MKKAALVVGARPQFIKTAPLIIELGRFFHVVLINTGQHYDYAMSELFFQELHIPGPDYHLGATARTAGQQIGRMIENLEHVLSYENPDLVIVVGDTNTTLSGAIITSRLNMPLAHVEAGVRAKNKHLPEQVNRVVTDSIADYFLCPTPSAVDNLRREGKTDHIYDTGDVIYDCLRQFEKYIPEKPSIINDLPDKFILSTIHRAEAVDNLDNLKQLIRSLSTADFPIIFPVHPRTRKMLQSFGLLETIPRQLILIEPLGYLDILSLIKRSELVVTDSGGVQREAIFLHKHVIVARPETEWIELEKSGWLKVMGYSFDLSMNNSGFNPVDDDLKHLNRPASKNIAEILNRILE
jgi:UDP-GlcNAc3NAcA epimerase